MAQIRTPIKAPKANAIAERWVRSIRNECLDHRLILGHQHLQRTINKYVDYYNQWRPHRSLGQKPPRAASIESRPSRSSAGYIMCINELLNDADGVFAPCS